MMNFLLRSLRKSILAGLLFSVLTQIIHAEAAQKSFDHITTGFDLFGAHATVSCDSCHVEGLFKGTPRDCATCHSLNGLVDASPRPIDHIQSSERCESCHTSTLWEEIVRVDHTQTLGACTSCHNDLSAEGLPPNHISTTEQCDACHSDLGWTPVPFFGREAR